MGCGLGGPGCWAGGAAGGGGWGGALGGGGAKRVAYGEGEVLEAAALVGFVVLLLGLTGAVRRGVVRCVAFAAGTGSAYGLVSVLVRNVTYSVEHGELGRCRC